MRGDVQGDNGYALSLDPTTSEFKLVKMTSGTPEELANHPIGTWLEDPETYEWYLEPHVIQADETFMITLEVNGDELTGKLYDANDYLLDTITITDSSYSTGSVGTWALRQSSSIEGSWSNMHLSDLSAKPDSYLVEQSIDSEIFTEVATAWGSEATVRNLAANTEYYFRVRAFTDAGYSEYSNTASATTTAATTAPSAPTSLGICPWTALK